MIKISIFNIWDDSKQLRRFSNLLKKKEVQIKQRTGEFILKPKLVINTHALRKINYGSISGDTKTSVQQ